MKFREILQYGEKCNYMEKISIIVPIYNSEKTLRTCINSLTDQTYKLLDIIVIDDGSTDKSSAICDELAANDRRIRVVHKENGGVVSARKVGIGMLPKRGFTTFCDADDYMPKDAIEKLYDCIKKTEADIVCGNLQKFFAHKIKLKKSTPSILSKEACYSREKIYSEILPSFFGITNFPGYVTAKLYKNTLLLETEEFKYPNIGFQEDMAFNLLCVLAAKKIAVIPDTIYYYRMGGATSRYMPNFLSDCLTLYRFKMEILDRENLPENMRYTTAVELKNECSFWLQMKYEYLRKIHSSEEMLDEIKYCCCIPEVVQAVNYPQNDNSGIPGFKEMMKNKQYNCILDLLSKESKKNWMKNRVKQLLLKV